MKALSELGISPAPWSADDWCESEHGEYDVRIRDANDNEIAQPLSTYDDACLMAAAPELYFHLHAAVLLCEFRKLVSENTIALWKSALAKASGDEVAK